LGLFFAIDETDARKTLTTTRRQSGRRRAKYDGPLAFFVNPDAFQQTLRIEAVDWGRTGRRLVVRSQKKTSDILIA